MSREMVLLFNCNLTSRSTLELSKYKIDCGDESANNSSLALFNDDPKLNFASGYCVKTVVAPVAFDHKGVGAVGDLLNGGFVLNWRASNCSACKTSCGRCGFDRRSYHFKCFCPDRPHAWHCTPGTNKMGLKLRLGIGSTVALLILLFCIFVLCRRHKQEHVSSSNFSSKSDLENSSAICFGLLIFSYNELMEATNNFDDHKVLGGGGFGTVYYGKLRDGREVAIKRLYQHNFRRHQQFVNEVEILTRLRHKNLVSLYGCTSRRSRELLLVYEFIPNGTVSDHLHGDRAQSGSLTWPVRMSIAVETATALAYLHASDIIHRDVKTTNILLDDNFSVKVADFGLSRLLPNDVTHISTAPQGTPGYVDPEYHQCYQLTEKSDVYSFGVVLIELISSMPAVDISRHRHEINLATLAINKIQKCAFDELIDTHLGYKSCEQVTGMTTLVAELAFRCLQQEKELRPSMQEVLVELQIIQSDAYELEKVQQEEHTDCEVMTSIRPPPSPLTGDQIVLLKDIRQPASPISVTDKWISQRTTPNASE
ncbi:LEAF RUST 10 DISEASE-RESISTANCE LOCUS RECEPTOR-LIKE PROTEIN KINASE-like 1.1 [Hibiscus syriacus]|nr:LEAF RUST 10 DISEASE-RESISTANCE LOCUS RECEPTOR-LIKE PROTEIN KINASE-like 1.1 [Hibiscus syriacus]